MIDILKHNRLSWNRQSREGSPWCTPVDSKIIKEARKGNWQVILTPLKPVPKSWFGDLKGKNVLCLASGGGQQAPIFAATGAYVVSFDLSKEQLDKDRLVAEQNGLQLKTVQGDMANLSPFANESFDLIFHPVSNVFSSDVKKVWNQCFRVLKRNGILLAGFMNPVFFLFDPDEIKKTNQLIVKYTLPYSDIKHLEKKRLQHTIDNKIALEFSHSLEDQIGGQIEAGFVINGFYEDYWDDEATKLNKYTPTFIATKAFKP
jgi:SAM-dependent methyltransferase